MATTGTKVAPRPETVDTALQNGEMVLLHLGAKQYYTLNGTGSRIWQLIGRGFNLGEITQALEDESEVSHDQAQGSVINLADLLVAENLVAFTDT